jgi:hypothetical protein
MSSLIKINDEDLCVKEINGQRVITFKDIDRLHNRTVGTAKRNFNDNKLNEDGTERIIENIDYFKTKMDSSKIRSEFGVGRNAGEVILITESGYLMLAKSLNDDLAWKVQRELLNSYFKVKDFRSADNIKAISLLHTEVGELIAATSQIEGKVEKIENTMTIDYSQQLTLSEMAKHKAVESMGGKSASAYKDSSLRGRVFSAVWKDYKEYFQVNSYKNTAVKDFERAKQYLESWKAQGKIQREIEDCN